MFTVVPSLPRTILTTSVSDFPLIDFPLTFFTISFGFKPAFSAGEPFIGLVTLICVKKIVLDLRNNPGGLLNEAVKMSNIFIDKNKPVVKLQKGNETEVVRAPSDALKEAKDIFINKDIRHFYSFV